jgi:hypothetical protein
MNAEPTSGRGMLAKWLAGGNFLQLVVSAADGAPSFNTVVQLTDVKPERIEATLPYVPFVNFVFILPPNAEVTTGNPDAGASPFETAEFSSRVREPWVVVIFPLGCVIAFGEIRE